jgi:hypothetical protein
MLIVIALFMGLAIGFALGLVWDEVKIRKAMNEPGENVFFAKHEFVPRHKAG